MLWLQRTVARDASLEGVGLHTGQTTRLTLAPAPPNTGLVFRVRCADGAAEIPALIEYVPADQPAIRNTTLARDGIRIFTVEHVLAALFGCGVTNCYIDLQGNEPPITSCGSALPYVELLRETGIRDQGLPAGYFRLQSTVALRERGVEIVAEPCDHLRLSMWVRYDDPLVGEQAATFEITPAVFKREIAPARTFAFMPDVLELRAKGYAQGGSLQTALVIEDGQLAGGQQFRFPDEIVRHKLLDLLGDLALLGMPLQAHVQARRTGHAANTRFTRMLAERERRSNRIFPRRRPDDFDIAAILEVMPHRYPMLLVDRIVELEPGRRVVGLKNVTFNEPFFQGHFPGHPIMPGVLIIEALAQTGGVLLLTGLADPRGKLVYFSGIDRARFRRPVLPGDVLTLVCDMLKLRGPVCKIHGTAYVGQEKVAEAELMASLVDA
ncbi:MAG: UDP-3-O-acyl-N-acetylglucosamine deacetylase [Candidatus Krumholzibacteria bacterium]|jgi:UDP-3-O-[3-hydroxymyristoyl] N-acetylglucosamine deacetylase/3-hydroxyacyl-[acyl-carrier-protein] dehydratase|nr:UDP-3-O-acyl-N-acetylglucosamine deacetylase [Candidatus Krumholzibacteria bacterium]